MQKLDSVTIQKRYRICRRHFDTECFNGGCRRLLNTAVPSLFLSGEIEMEIKQTTPRTTINEIDLEEQEAPLEEITYVPISIDDDNPDEHFELIVSTSVEQPKTRGKFAYYEI